MRRPSENDFAVPVEGLGTFTFARRRLKDEIAIQVERSKILGGTEFPTDFLWNLGAWLSTIRVLMVLAPNGWNPDELDPLEPETFDEISRVFVALREKEDSFRRKPRKGSEEQGEADSKDGGLLVPPEVQPAAQ